MNLRRISKEEAFQMQMDYGKVIGKHVYGNLYGIERNILTNMNALSDMVIKAAQIGNMHIVSMLKKQFKIPGLPDNGGVSIIALIKESHIAVHTWPESEYATVDIYSCGAHTDADAAFTYIISVLKPRTYTKSFADRSN